MDQRDVFTAAIKNVAQLCAVAAMTAPKSGGPPFLKGTKTLLPTPNVRRRETLRRPPSCLRERGAKGPNTPFLPEAAAARHLGIIESDLAVALSMSVTHKNIFFDRPSPQRPTDASAGANEPRSEGHP